MQAIERLRALVADLCAPACAGRAPGTPEGRAARARIAQAFGEAGLRVREQSVPGSGGANLIATVGGGRAERALLVGAHYDHLGRGPGPAVYWGADDNAAAVAIVVELARALVAAPPDGHDVILCAFDSEEPPYFLSEAMGSEYFARNPTVPLDRIDLMVALDLVGHALGEPGLPKAVRDTVFVLGAEASEGTSALVDGLAPIEGVIPRRAGCRVIPPLSDYAAFQERGVPFLFVTGGRWRHYHQTTDTPDRLDYGKMAATAKWLEALVRAAASRPGPVRFLPEAADDASTVEALRELVAAVGADWPGGRRLLARLDALVQAAAASEGRLPMGPFAELLMLVATVEGALA